MKTPIVLFIDDDTRVTTSVADNLRLDLKEQNCGFWLGTSLDDVKTFLSQGNLGNAIPVIAIVDIWMNDPKTNTSDTKGGFAIINLLRQAFPSIHVIVYSGHVDLECKKQLDRYSNMSIYKKEGADVTELETLVQGKMREICRG